MDAPGPDGKFQGRSFTCENRFFGGDALEAGIELALVQQCAWLIAGYERAIRFVGAIQKTFGPDLRGSRCLLNRATCSGVNNHRRPIPLNRAQIGAAERLGILDPMVKGAVQLDVMKSTSFAAEEFLESTHLMQ